jgi:iron complex outermembrane receptor protein
VHQTSRARSEPGEGDGRIGRIRLRAALSATTALVGLAWACPTWAADAPANPVTVPEVIVTAERIEQNLQQVPVTVTAVTPEVLRQENITRPSELLFTVPSLTVAPSFNRLNNGYSIRGLAAGVATYFEESPCCTGSASVPFQDVRQVQVLNGPQGTLFGRTSGAGAILIAPNRPNLSEFGGSAEFRVGDYGRFQFFGVLNAPIIRDHLALRIAGNTNYVQGYTQYLNGRGRYDDENNQQIRVGLEFRQGAFDDYLVGQVMNVHEAASGQILRAAAVNNVSLYNLTPAAAVATFTPVCTNAVGLGFYPDVTTCINQRAGTLTQIRNNLVNELARVQGGGSAIRLEPAPLNDQPSILWLRDKSILNSARYEFPAWGPLQVTLRDIASMEWCTNDTASPGDGAGGGAEQNGAFNTCGVANNNVSNGVVTVGLGPYSRTFNNDLQAQINIDDGLLRGTVGYFYTKTKNPAFAGGTNNIYQLYLGVLNLNAGGFNSAVGFFAPGNYSRETAGYGQFTLDVSRFGVHGLKLTAGYRYSKDINVNPRYPAVVNNLTGVFTPGTTPSTSIARSSGYNYTLSASEQFTNDLMAYATVARAYIPGGVNANIQNATGLPNYAPTFGPQIVLEQEVGVKYDFRLGGMAGRIDAAAYNYDFTDIAVGFSGLAGTVSVAYTANVAAAKLRGVEVQGTLLPSSRWDIRAAYNYNDARYTNWTASDPVNAARPGDAICLPSSPSGFCLLDLTNNPFVRMPEHQAHLTVVYHAPIDPNLGRLDLSGTAYTQSRVYFVSSAARQLQILGPAGLPGISQAPYATLNLRASWEEMLGSRWSGALFVNNVTDTVYVNATTAQLLTLGFATGTYAPPRMYGIELRRDF